MAAQVRPAALAEVLDVAERPRSSGWSLRAALVRYAQPQPQRASELIGLVRRVESALRPSAKVLEHRGPAVWDAVAGDGTPVGETPSVDDQLVALLRVAIELDRIGDVLAAWAVDADPGVRPDAAVDAVVRDVVARLDALGVEREQRARPPAGRTRG